MAAHKHLSPLRGTKVLPHPAPGNPLYQPINYTYADQRGNIHEVVTIGGRELAKVGFPDKKIVYYLLEDLERLGGEREEISEDHKLPNEDN
jgi:hypothetical protein